MSKKRKAKAAIWVIGFALLLPLAYFAGLKNDWRLWQLSHSLANINHPPNTQRLAFVKDVGLLIGNGNHCDFFVAELRSYNQSGLTPQQIEAFYANTTIWNPLEEKSERVYVGTIGEGVIRSGRGWSDMEQFFEDYFPSHWPRKLQNQKLYVLFNFSVGYEAGCDLRCH